MSPKHAVMRVDLFIEFLLQTEFKSVTSLQADKLPLSQERKHFLEERDLNNNVN